MHQSPLTRTASIARRGAALATLRLAPRTIRRDPGRKLLCLTVL